jgi:hypothetical protein
MALPVPGSLAAFMDELEALERTVHPDLVVYRWRPRGSPDLPAIWNWLPESPAEIYATDILRETLDIRTVVGVQRSDAGEMMADVELYADAFREIVDPAILLPPVPLNGAASKVRRTAMRTVLDDFGGVDVFGVEFRFDVQLDRRIA